MANEPWRGPRVYSIADDPDRLDAGGAATVTINANHFGMWVTPQRQYARTNSTFSTIHVYPRMRGMRPGAAVALVLRGFQQNNPRTPCRFSTLQ